MGLLSIVFLSLLSLALRLYLMFEFPHVVYLHEADAMGYFAIARSMLDTWGLGSTSTHFPPFYPFLIGVAYLFSGDIEIAGRLVSSIMGALLVFPVFLIGKELYDKRAGFLSTIIVVFFQPFVDASLAPLSQTTYLTLLTTAVYIGIVLIKKSSLMLYLLLGLTLGATYLTRPEGIVVFVFFLVMVSIVLFLNNDTPVKERLKRLFALTTGFLILSLPYINYLHKQTGMWTISGKAATTIIGVDASARLLPGGKTVGESATVGIRNAFPGIREFIHTYWQNIGRFENVLIDHLPVIYLSLALFGFITILASIFKEGEGSRRFRVFQTISSLGGLVAVLPVFAFSNLAAAVSYILPVFPMLVTCLSIGLISIENALFTKIVGLLKLKRLERVKQYSLGATAVIVFLSYSSFSPVWREQSSEDFRYFAASQKFFLKDTGLWLKFNSPKDSAIMTRWSNIAFYAERKHVALVDGEMEDVIKYAKNHNVSHIVIDSNAVPYRRPKLAPLLNPSVPHQGLKPVYAMEKYWIRVVIYEVL